jgi:hypothetical protein
MSRVREGAAQSREARTVHQDRLCHVVCVVARDDMVDAERCSAAIQRLSSEDAAERT